jgi:predicted metal-dependent HD superfamily phosphohydrolase
MFDMAKLAKLRLSEAQVLAIWYHDAVYIPGDGENVHNSAELAKKHLKGQLAEETLNKVEQIILDTNEHKATIEESRAVVDLDLSILGANPESYKVYMQLIRKEYSTVPYKKYAVGRSEFLNDMIKRAKRKRLYSVMGELLNDPAIENMNMELKLLKDKPKQEG